MVKVISYHYIYSHQPSAGILTMFSCRRNMISFQRDRRTANQTMPTINDEEGLKTTKLTLHVPTADPSIADALEKDLGGKGVGSGWTGDEGKPKGLQAR